MDLPENENKTIEPQNPVDLNKPGVTFPNKGKNLKLILIGISVFLIIILLIVAFSVGGTQKSNQTTATDSSQSDINKAKQTQQDLDQAAKNKSLPINQIQQAYTDIVGSESYKKTLTLDTTTGITTINYIIPSTDGPTIIKTSYENFADLAARIFNIPSVTRLNVSTYATKFTDNYGTPNQVALTMQITKATNDKVNWSVKKYSYKDYATILDVHQLNTALAKDYKELTKTTN